MTPMALFFRTFLRTIAVSLGVALVVLQPPFLGVQGSDGRRVQGAEGPRGQRSGSNLNHPDRSHLLNRRDLPDPSHATIQEVSNQLTASDPAVRARAACDLREHADRAGPAIDALIALLPDAAPLERSVCGENWWRWNPENTTTPGEQAASVLVAIGSRAFEPLLKALKHPAWVARRNAAWALGALDDTRAVAPLLPLMNDPEAAVREQVAWALGALDDSIAVPTLIAGLKDGNPRVRRQAAWAAGAIDDPRAVDPLMIALRDEHRTVREQAAWALGAIGDSRAVDALLPLLKDSEPAVRRQAAWAIGVLAR